MQGYHRPAHTSPCIWRLHRLWITIANTRHCSPTNITAPIAANILKDTDTVRTSDTRPKEGYIYIRTHRRRDDPRKGYTDNDRAIRDEAMADRLEAPHLARCTGGSSTRSREEHSKNTRGRMHYLLQMKSERYALYDVLLCLPLCYTTLITLASEGVSVQTTSKLRPLLNLS